MIEEIVKQLFKKTLSMEMAIKFSKLSNKNFEEALVESGQLTDEEMAMAISKQLGFKNKIDLFQKYGKNLPKKSYCCQKENLIILDDSCLITTHNSVNSTLGLSFNRLKGVFPDQVFIVDIKTMSLFFESEQTKISNFENFKNTSYLPANLLIDDLLIKAHEFKSTDIHIEPTYPQGFKVRFRINGHLITISENSDSELFKRIISRITVLCKMPATSDALAEGSFEFKTNNCSTDIRVSIIPVQLGKSIAMRLHSSHIRKMDILKLGMDDKDLKLIKNCFSKSNGLVLFSGPTGSGKTTSLYSCAENFCSREKKIITVEDPVEYILPWAVQISIGEKEQDIKINTALKACLKHDPDIIIIGEIRDQKSAIAAVEMARTGHLVIATIHGLSAKSTIKRLMDYNINPSTIAEVLTLVVNQRLVPLLQTNEKRCTRTGIFSLSKNRDIFSFDEKDFSRVILKVNIQNELSNKADLLIKKNLCHADVIEEIL